jgi:hypothetical protein
MDKILGYLNAFGTSWKMCKSLSDEYGGIAILYWLDYMLCRKVHGVDSRQYSIGEFHKKSESERRATYTVKRSIKVNRHFNDSSFIHLFDFKPDFNRYFSKWVKRDWLLMAETDYDEFLNFIYKHNNFMVKKVDGMQGEGIYKQHITEEVDTRSLYEKLKKDNVMIEELIVQHPRMRFGGNTVNTIRVMSLLDKNSKCMILKTDLRVSTGSDMDNYHMGGCLYSVDEQTGIVDSKGRSMKSDGFIYHPNTDIQMLGYQIPNWNVLLREIKAAHESIPQCRSIGWDVAITDDTIELVEGNADHDYELYECFQKKGFWRIFKKYW